MNLVDVESEDEEDRGKFGALEKDMAFPLWVFTVSGLVCTMDF